MPFKEKHPEPKTPRQLFMEILDDLCEHIPGIAQRREMLLLIPGLMDEVAGGLVMDAIVHGKGIVNTITDVGSDTIALVYNSGWALGFEGDGGELVILIQYISSITPRKTGLQIDMETGETVWLRFLGRKA